MNFLGTSRHFISKSHTFYYKSWRLSTQVIGANGFPKISNHERSYHMKMKSSPGVINKGCKATSIGIISTVGVTFFSTAAAESIANNPNSSTSTIPVKLYQYQPCPYCCKVKAVLDFLKVPYEVIEVNPLTKKETKFTEYNKVPIAIINGKQVNDSSEIITEIRDQIAQGKIIPIKQLDKLPVLSDGSESEAKWREWVDKKFIILMPPNIYRSWSESLESFDYVLTKGKFSSMERFMAKYAGAGVMFMVSKKLNKKYGIKDPRQSLNDAIDTWMNEIGDKKFHGGEHPNLADLSVFGVLRSINGLRTFDDVILNTKLLQWYQRMENIVGETSCLN